MSAGEPANVKIRSGDGCKRVPELGDRIRKFELNDDTTVERNEFFDGHILASCCRGMDLIMEVLYCDSTNVSRS